MSELFENAVEVTDRDSFAKFIGSLSEDLKANPQDWENRDLLSYLQALDSWIQDMDGYYKNLGLSQPSNINWKFFADALMAARVYE